MMIVTFSGGEKRFDASVLTGSAFKPLEDDAIFSNFKIMHGVITLKFENIASSSSGLNALPVKTDASNTLFSPPENVTIIIK